MNDLIFRNALLAAYDAAHKGPPGGARKLIEQAPAIRCEGCKHCMKISNPPEAWDGSGDGSFMCDSWEADFYAPTYTAQTYFCGDYKPREEG